MSPRRTVAAAAACPSRASPAARDSVASSTGPSRGSETLPRRSEYVRSLRPLGQMLSGHFQRPPRCFQGHKCTAADPCGMP
eukprot:scaffold32872_cov84-Phaeocystis_antarctica.AAC.3